MTPNVLIIQIRATILTCYVVVLKPAGKIKDAEAPVLLHFFEQQLMSICEGMNSSEAHHGQGYIISQYRLFLQSFQGFILCRWCTLQKQNQVKHRHSKAVLINSS